MPRRKRSNLGRVSNAARKAKLQRLKEPPELRLRRLAAVRNRTRHLRNLETPEQREVRLSILRERQTRLRGTQRKREQRMKEKTERRELKLVFSPFDLWINFCGEIEKVFVTESRSFEIRTNKNVDNDPLALTTDAVFNNSEYEARSDEMNTDVEDNFSSDVNTNVIEISSFYIKQDNEEPETELKFEIVKHEPIEWMDNENAILSFNGDVPGLDSEFSVANHVEQHIQVSSENQILPEVPQSLHSSEKYGLVELYIHKNNT